MNIGDIIQDAEKLKALGPQIAGVFAAAKALVVAIESLEAAMKNQQIAAGAPPTGQV